MTHGKDIENIEGLASAGGAMAKWPLRTIWWACRTERTQQTDPHVIDALMAKDVSDCEDLSEKAHTIGIRTGQLDAKADALRAADAGDLMSVLADVYDAVYGQPSHPDHGRPATQCPYEREGSDMACQRCPVAGLALQELRNRGDTDGQD